MLRPSRLTAILSAAALVTTLAACSQDDGDSASKEPSASSSGSPSTKTEQVAESAPPAGTPTVKFNQPLSPDVTEKQLQELLDEGAVPIAPAHGGAFETMVNAVTNLDSAPDVMLFGDSMTQQGVDPEVLGKELAKKAGSDVLAFNGASSRARWGINRMLARYLVKADRVPDVALLAISTRAAESDQFYKNDASKFPFSSLAEGCDREFTEFWTKKDQANCEKDVSDLRHRFRAGGSQVQRGLDGEGVQTSLAIDKDSWLRSDGMMIHPGISEKQSRAASDKRMKRGFPGFPTVHDEAVEQFEETKEILEKAGATVIAFELPYSPPHQANLDEVGRDYDLKRQRSAKTMADTAGVKLFQVKSFGDWWGDGDSRDAIHLAPQGGANFARQLVNDTPGFADAVLAGLED